MKITVINVPDGVRVVLEQAGHLGDSARVDDLVGLVAAAEKALEKSRESLTDTAEELRHFKKATEEHDRAFGAIVTILDIPCVTTIPDCTDIVRAVTRCAKERDEQKARADRAEAALHKAIAAHSRIENEQDQIRQAGAAAFAQERDRAVAAYDRISALEKAVGSVLPMLVAYGQFVDSSPALDALRAALDAPQPNQDSGQHRKLQGVHVMKDELRKLVEHMRLGARLATRDASHGEAHAVNVYADELEALLARAEEPEQAARERLDNALARFTDEELEQLSILGQCQRDRSLLEELAGAVLEIRAEGKEPTT